MASWLGKRVQDLRAEKQLSWIAHLVSYAVTLAALFTTMAGSAGLAGHLHRLCCWRSPCSSFLPPRCSPECSFCGPAALREHSQHTFGALIGGPVTATIDASWSRSRSQLGMRVYPERRADSSAGVTNRYPVANGAMTDSYSGPSLARSRRTDVDGTRAAVVVISPDIAQQLLAAEHASRVLCEVFQQLELGVGEIQLNPVELGAVASLVDHDVAGLDHRDRRWLRQSASSRA